MRRFAPWWSMVALLFLLGATAALAEHEAEKAAARKATESWLALTDAGDAGKSWESASDLFRKAVSKEQWRETLDAVRKPLGKLSSRNLKSAEFATSLPGAPDGAYVVLQYQSVFANKASATETVTPMREKDGSWRVSGYYVR